MVAKKKCFFLALVRTEKKNMKNWMKIGRFMKIREFTKGLSSPLASLKSTKACTWYLKVIVFFIWISVILVGGEYGFFFQIVW